MSDPSASSMQVRPRRFQFGLKTALVVMTGTSVILSLTSCSIELGALVAIPLVGVWWTVLAIRAGHRGVAYHLASVLLGEATAFFATFTLFWATDSPISLIEWDPQLFVVLLSGTTAIFLCAALMRRKIRRPGTRAVVNVGVVCAYLASLAWVCLAALFFVVLEVVQGGGGLMGDLLEGAVYLLAGTTFAVSLTLPFVGGYATGACAILRAIHPLGSDLTDEERAVFEAIVQLRWEERPPVVEEILARTGLAPERAEEVLERLLQKRLLRHWGAKGYRPR